MAQKMRRHRWITGSPVSLFEFEATLPVILHVGTQRAPPWAVR